MERQRDTAGATVGLGPGLFTLQLVNAWRNLREKKQQKWVPEEQVEIKKQVEVLSVQRFGPRDFLKPLG